MIKLIGLFFAKWWSLFVGAHCLVVRESPSCESFVAYWFHSRWSNTSYTAMAFERDFESEKRVHIAKTLSKLAAGQLKYGVRSFWKFKGSEEIFAIEPVE